MKNFKLYYAKFKNNIIYVVKEDNNTIGQCFRDENDAKNYLNDGVGHPFAVSCNNEVMAMGASLGFIELYLKTIE